MFPHILVLALLSLFARILLPLNHRGLTKGTYKVVLVIFGIKIAEK